MLHAGGPTDSQTDRHEELNNLFFFQKFPKAPKNNQISNFMEIHPVGVLFNANRRTDGRAEGNSRLLQNCERRLRNWLHQTKRHLFPAKKIVVICG